MPWSAATSATRRLGTVPARHAEKVRPASHGLPRERDHVDVLVSIEQRDPGAERLGPLHQLEPDHLPAPRPRVHHDEWMRGRGRLVLGNRPGAGTQRRPSHEPGEQQERGGNDCDEQEARERVDGHHPEQPHHGDDDANARRPPRRATAHQAPAAAIVTPTTPTTSSATLRRPANSNGTTTAASAARKAPRAVQRQRARNQRRSLPVIRICVHRFHSQSHIIVLRRASSISQRATSAPAGGRYTVRRSQARSGEELGYTSWWHGFEEELASLGARSSRTCGGCCPPSPKGSFGSVAEAEMRSGPKDDGGWIMAVCAWRWAYHRVLGWHAPALRRAAVVLVIEFVATLLLLPYAPWEWAVILGWAFGAAAFLASTGHMIIRADATDTEMLAGEEDATRTAGALVLVTVCTVSLLGVGFAIRLARDRSGGLRVVLGPVSKFFGAAVGRLLRYGAAMPNFVLVAGARLGAWAWDEVVPYSARGWPRCSPVDAVRSCRKAGCAGRAADPRPGHS